MTFRGTSLLELIIATGILSLVLTIMIPNWETLFTRTTTLRTSIRRHNQLNWIADRACDDIRFSENATYQFSNTRLKRIQGQSIQTLNTFPITQWEVTPSDSCMAIQITMPPLTLQRRCVRW
jgi:Tfp pilus assembly protein PilE